MITIEHTNQATGLRRVAVALSAAAIISFVASYHVGVAPAVLFDNVEKFGRKKAAVATFEHEDTCKSRSGPVHSFLNSAVDRVVAKVPGSRVSDLADEIDINVGPVEVKIAELMIEALAVGSVDYDSCGGLAHGLKVHLSGIDLGIGLHYDEHGKWGRSAASGDAKTDVTGTIDLTISELSQVTECEAHLSVGEIMLVGERAGQRAASNIPLPIGKILCFGRGSFEGLVAMLNNAFASLQDKKPKVLGEGTHLRPLTLPQRPTARGSIGAGRV